MMIFMSARIQGWDLRYRWQCFLGYWLSARIRLGCTSIMNSKFLRIKRERRERGEFLGGSIDRSAQYTHPLALRGARVGMLAMFLCWGIATVSAAERAPTLDLDIATQRQWVEAMKLNPRGPFDQIRWFCEDGARLLPTPSACEPHGGGHQHGQWSPRTKSLREAGFRIANFYADLEIDELLAADPTFSPLAQMLIEQFLIRADDGWILRQARYYRGAFQEEGERKGARALLLRLLNDADWITSRFLFLRTAISTLPHGTETASVREIRQLAATLSDRDTLFKPLRNQIHGRMKAGDAAEVRAYAERLATGQGDFLRLANLLDALYARDASLALNELLLQLPSTAALRGALKPQLVAWQAPLSTNGLARAPYLSRALAVLRDGVLDAATPTLRLQVMEASLLLEAEYFTLLGELTPTLASGSRRARLDFTRSNIDALYGTGLISARQRGALNDALDEFLANSKSPTDYKRTADYLALAPHWATQAYRLHFGLAIDQLTPLEPKTALFIQDALRGSPLVSYAAVMDSLVRDANQTRGVRNELFGEDVGGGLRGLNPGLARGVLHLVSAEVTTTTFERQGIYVLPETVADLPPVRGIVTAGEGNPLSHVQLLARNLGIPNVAIEERNLEKLRPYDGKEIVLAVSPGGSVRLALMDAQTSALFDLAPAVNAQPVITVDLAKLDLTKRDFINLSALRAADSGRIVGPKAAKLGELKFHYPEAVADGVAIPFGAFRAVLEQPLPGSTSSIFDWMKGEYARLAMLPRDSAEQRHQTEALRSRLEHLIAEIDPGAGFRAALGATMREVFGAHDKVGVFVRSDTNVEDLPGFTGAGLNLTLPNVVGQQEIFKAIAKVWASPFSARSFAWRQALMTTPEHVYPAVLLLKSVDNDKSGVLVTHDIDTRSTEWLSVALNEGVGGAVDGQSAESVRIRISDGSIRLLAQATAPLRRQIAPAGGITLLPVSGLDAVLQPSEARLLVNLARELPQKFPPIVDAQGVPAPADIEFGFLNGALQLFQIRPFLDNAAARGATYLLEMDALSSNVASTQVDLEQVP